MEYYRSPGSDSEPKDRTLLRILLAGLGCLFVIAAAVAFLFGRFLFSAKAPNRVVQTHLEAVNNGNFELAYRYFDLKFQRDTSLTEFRSQIKEFSSLLPYKESALNRIKIVNARAVVDGLLTGRNGTIFPVHYELSKSNGAWKITKYRWTPPGETITL